MKSRIRWVAWRAVRAPRAFGARKLSGARLGAAAVVTAIVPMLAVSLASCAERGSSAHTQASSGSDAVVVSGTCVDAQTGEPLRGVEIRGPHGVHAVSDAHGRFELRGLAPGDHGELAAKDSRGRVRTLALRPLEAGPLEVVVHIGP